MFDTGMKDGKIGLVNWALAALVGVLTAATILVWGVPGMDPSLWNDAAVAAGVRPAHAIFPGYWRIFAHGLFAAFGVSGALRVLTALGAAVGGGCAALVYLAVRQALTFLVRVGRPYPVWSNRIAPFFSFVAALLFGVSDPLTRLAWTFSPALLHVAAFLLCVVLTLRWLRAGGRWTLFPCVALMGLLAAETPFAFLLPLALVGAYVIVWHGIMDGLFEQPERLPSPKELPKWRMFFLFLGVLAVGVWANVTAFAAFGGLKANGWTLADAYFRYPGGYLRAFLGSASVVGWVLGLGFGILPLVVAVTLFPRVSRDDRPMPFNLGVMLFFAGAISFLQVGVFPATRFWTLSRDVVHVSNGALLALFAAAAMVAFALFGAAFAFACQCVDRSDDEDRPGVLLRGLVPTLTVLFALLAFRSVPKATESEMQRIVDDAVHETVRECDGAKFIFTDGHLDPALELVAREKGRALYALSMMSGAGNWEQTIRTRPFAEGTDDWRNAKIGVPSLLRVWAGEKADGMEGVAIQLGFEFWKRDRRPLPRLSGLVARERGMSQEAADEGIERAKALSARILALAGRTEAADPSPALADAFSAVSWRLARLARAREDTDTANGLDASNTALRKMLEIVDQERMRTFMQLTPREGLQLALRRADFTEARRYAASVLRGDEDDVDANFGMGMSELKHNRLEDAERYLRRCLKRRPKEPAVLNNLSIICRKRRNYKDAEAFARQAAEILPDSPEVKQTLADALKKAP